MSETVASTILLEAASITNGIRNATHGERERSFDAIAKLWHAYNLSKKDPDAPDNGYDVAQKMVLLKMARANQGIRIRDHFVDQAGYSATAGEIAAKEGGKP